MYVFFHLLQASHEFGTVSKKKKKLQTNVRYVHGES